MSKKEPLLAKIEFRLLPSEKRDFQKFGHISKILRAFVQKYIRGEL